MPCPSCSPSLDTLIFPWSSHSWSISVSIIDLEKWEGKEKEKTRVNLFCELDLELPYLIDIMVFFKYWILLEVVTRQKEDPSPTQIIEDRTKATGPTKRQNSANVLHHLKLSPVSGIWASGITCSSLGCQVPIRGLWDSHKGPLSTDEGQKKEAGDLPKKYDKQKQSNSKHPAISLLSCLPVSVERLCPFPQSLGME